MFGLKNRSTLPGTKIPSLKTPPSTTTYGKIVIVGIHGWALLGGYVTGNPQITSKELADNLKKSLEEKILTCTGDIATIELHGHGTILQRVKLHLNFLRDEPYRTQLRESDHIYFCCHSQGCVVGSILLKELIDLNWIKADAQDIHFLGMAGVHHGCYPSSVQSDGFSSTKELFTLSEPGNLLAETNLFSLLQLLNHGVKVFLMAGFCDEVVPLHSALAIGLGTHPNLRRSVFVDGKLNLEENNFILELLESLCRLSSNGVLCDLLPHLGGFYRNSLLQTKNIGRYHTALRLSPSSFDIAADWFHQNREQNCIIKIEENEKKNNSNHDENPLKIVKNHKIEHVVELFQYSSVWWIHGFGKTYYGSKVNLYLLKKRFLYFLNEMKTFESQKELIQLKFSFHQWQPLTEEQKLLKNELSPFFPRPKL